MIRAYVNTPATAKLAMLLTNILAYLLGFFVGSQKTLRIILIRYKLTELEQKQWKHVLRAEAPKERAQSKTNASTRIEIFCT